MIASPEMLPAAAGQRTHTIRLGTGMVSLPYDHPFNVAQRIAGWPLLAQRPSILPPRATPPKNDPTFRPGGGLPTAVGE